MILKWNNYHEIDKSEWLWSHFSPKELACHCCGQLHIDTNLMDRLQRLREDYGTPVVISSGYRCPIHNARVGGRPKSMHKAGKAADIVLNGLSRDELFKRAKAVGFTGYGFYNTFLHVDVGPARSWSS